MPGVVLGFPTGPLYLISSSDELLIIISPDFFSTPSSSRLSRGDTTVKQKEKQPPSPSNFGYARIPDVFVVAEFTGWKRRAK